MTERIKDNYFVHLLADNLPAVTRWELENDVVQVCTVAFWRFCNQSLQYEHGYKLGVTDGDRVFLHNHLIINLKYNRLDSDDATGPSYRIVAFDVLPHSIDEMKPGTVSKF